MEEIKHYFQEKNLRSFKKGTIILYQGDISPCVYYVRSGYIRIYDIDDHGNQKLIMIFGRDNMFPNARLTSSPSPSAYYWEAMTDCQMYCADANEMVRSIKADRELAYCLYDYSVKLIATLQNRILGLLQTFTSQKVPMVLKFLLDYAGHTKAGQGTLDVAISHQDIASLASVARETVSLEMKKLKNQGVISYQGRKLVIDTEKLDDIADEIHHF